MSEYTDSLEGYTRPISPFVPSGDSKDIVDRKYVAGNEYIQGAPQVFADIDELIVFHPKRMKAGMPATILNYPTAGTITDFRLGVNPSTLLNASGGSIVTLDNFSQYWIIQSQTVVKNTTVYQYAPDTPGGGQPVHNPYLLANEYLWANVRDDSKGHRWLRFRNDDIDSNNDTIFDNWSVPILIGTQFITGDYVENRFKRQAVNTVPKTSTAGLLTDKYYQIESGTLQIEGDLELNDIGEYGTTTLVILSVTSTFKYVPANTYTFNACSVLEIIPVPPKSVAGLPNNEPAGWTDTIPVGADQLWQITAQKSVYGQLKSAWVLKKISEDPNLIRYSNSPSPQPDTIAGRNTSAAEATPEDADLELAGWSKTYNNQNFIATRAIDPAPEYLYTSWVIEKINEESGEYVDRVFKLFDLNLDSDSVEVTAPVNRDPTTEGWADVPLQETDTQINFVSETRKFFNGELKTAWSTPIPYTGKDIFIDAIDSTSDDFHYESDGITVQPTLITLTAKLFKGITPLWENVALDITYVWKRVYNGGDVEDTTAVDNPANDFYIDATDAPYRAGQRLFIKPAAIDGNAVFRVTQSFTLSTGNVLEFEEEINLLDITDGLDAKALALRPDSNVYIYDSVGLVFAPANVVLKTYVSNIVSPTFYFYKNTGTIAAPVWVKLTMPITGYAKTGGILTIDIAVATLFATNATAQEIQFAVTTEDIVDPLLAEFYDTVTIAKLGSANVGSPGENSVIALLSNETQAVVLDTTTQLPATGEVAKATSRISFYNGLTKLDYNTAQFTAVVAESQFTISNPGDGDALISLKATGAGGWVVPQRSYQGTITLVGAGKTLTKVFSLASTLDAPGAIILDLDPDTGLIFDPLNRGDKTVTANLYVGSSAGTNAIALPDGAKYEFRFNVSNSWLSWAAANTRLITRNNVLVNGSVICEVRRFGELTAFASRTIKMTDVLDGKTYRAFTIYTTQPTTGQSLTNQDPTSVFGAGDTAVALGSPVVSWYLQSAAYWTTNPNTQVWEQEAEEYIDTLTDTAKWRWSTPKQIKGEAGSQGPNGDFYYTMYRSVIAIDPLNPLDPAYTTAPSLGASGNVSTLAQMKVASWLSILPLNTTGIIWKTERLWNGEGVTFDVNGDPSTTPVGATNPWNVPIRVSSRDGNPGAVSTTPGPEGPQGPQGIPGPVGPTPVAAQTPTQIVNNLSLWNATQNIFSKDYAAESFNGNTLTMPVIDALTQVYSTNDINLVCYIEYNNGVTWVPLISMGGYTIYCGKNQTHTISIKGIDVDALTSGSRSYRLKIVGTNTFRCSLNCNLMIYSIARP